MQNTKIQWANHTFNPWWGCQKVSSGCANCYAETLANRFDVGLWGGPDTRRKVASEHAWKEPRKWNRHAQKRGARERVFCLSMGDLFEDREDLVAPRLRLFNLIECTPHLDWLLLTKRPENMARMAPAEWESGGWPINAWAGVSVENQAMARERINHLSTIPAPVLFLSIEPLLDGVNLEPWIYHDQCGCVQEDVSRATTQFCHLCNGTGAVTVIDWVIVGGESGAGAREMAPEWLGFIERQCEVSGIPVFIKQLGTHLAIKMELKDKKGGNPDEWPPEWRVRQFPRPAKRPGKGAKA